MSKSLASGLRWKLTVPLVSCALLMLVAVTTAHARGKGPVGIWPASERYVLVADTSLPGLVLVDLQTGAAVERIQMENARPVGVASCAECTFALIVGGRSDSGVKANVWRLHFSDTVSRLLAEHGRLGLQDARLEMLTIAVDGEKLNDGRMALVSDDGKTAFIASSDDKALVRVELAGTPTTKSLLRHRKAKPFGLNWDRDGNLLLTMHKHQVWRMATDGKILAQYDTKKAGCPGANELKPNLRAAVDDPVNAGNLLVLASNPRSYDAVVWRLSVDAEGKQSCTNAAGKIGHDSGWIDAAGEAIEFSRPHHFAALPGSQPPQLVISDIDNRGLRLLDLTTYASTSVMYDRDRVVEALPPGQRQSTASCDKLGWSTAASFAGAVTCVKPAPREVMDVTLAQASAHCKAAGARLCEPAEILSTQSASAINAWTAAECASCWQRSERKRCVIMEQDHKTPDSVHSHKDFAHSWRSGQALVASVGGKAVTLCRPFDDTLKAAAFCCADETPDAVDVELARTADARRGL